MPFLRVLKAADFLDSTLRRFQSSVTQANQDGSAVLTKAERGGLTPEFQDDFDRYREAQANHTATVKGFTSWFGETFKGVVAKATGPTGLIRKAALPADEVDSYDVARNSPATVTKHPPPAQPPPPTEPAPQPAKRVPPDPGPAQPPQKTLPDKGGPKGDGGGQSGFAGVTAPLPEALWTAIKRADDYGNDNWWPRWARTEGPSRYVLEKPEAEKVAAAIRALPDAEAKDTIKAFSVHVVRGGLGCVYPREEGVAVFDALAREYGLHDLSFVGPKAAPRLSI